MDDEIKSYVYSNEGKGKAGGYGIHGPAGKFISRIEGSYTNVVGLPVHETYEILSDLKLFSFYWQTLLFSLLAFGNLSKISFPH